MDTNTNSAKTENKSKKNLVYSLVLISIIAIFLLGIFIIKPAVIGFVAYNNIKNSNQSIEDYGKSIQELNSKILVYETNLSVCNAYNDKFMSEMKTYTTNLNECSSKLTGLQINYDAFKNKTDEQILNINQELAKKDESIKTSESNYNLLAQNTANNLCCKAKIDNPNIKAYKVENNKVVCLEEGEKNISC